MPHYHIFGEVFRSEVPFPELIPAEPERPPRWVLTRVPRERAIADLELVGTEAVEKDINVTLSANRDVLRLRFDDSGTFDISADGHRIEWAARDNPDLEAIRKDVLGRVFAVCLRQQGIPSLHGSAVALNRVAVAFIAPKFHGKSTTAMALVEAGGKLLADDLVAITDESVPAVLPSVPFVQVWKDSADRLARTADAVIGDPESPKVRLRWGASAGLRGKPAPLAAVYLLAPSKADPGSAVQRELLPPVQGALVLLGQAKIVGLLGGAHRAALLSQMADLADRVPVYRLEVPRDFGRIAELTSSLWAWHPS